MYPFATPSKDHHHLLLLQLLADPPPATPTSLGTLSRTALEISSIASTNMSIATQSARGCSPCASACQGPPAPP